MSGNPLNEARALAAQPEAAPELPTGFRVVGLGASAGGLDACQRLLDGLGDGHGMAFILVQHLDPSHASMMVDLLASHTTMVVCEAEEGMVVEPGRVYVIPPGSYLSMNAGQLHLVPSPARHGARMPFDFLLQSLAADCGSRAVCVVLSGTGTDGSIGLRAIKSAGGLVLAQDPADAGYDGMPSNAIATGDVDQTLSLAGIADALIAGSPAAVSGMAGALREIIELLRTTTVHDFTLYKPGTLRRRIERRMGLVGLEPSDMAGYLELLRTDHTERGLLARDLLINVTSFFRDPRVFDLLARDIVPDLVRNQPAGQPLRIWIAGCSTGEETYSLTMLFRDEITSTKANVKLQVFASDVDADAVSQAREGLYPASITADITPERLGRFFVREAESYRVTPDLRSFIVFTVQDVLADPPFSRLDFVSCRNLLIYLRPEAQADVIALFHFALRPGGVLLLGSAETTGSADHSFEIISKPARLYRHIGRSRPGELRFNSSSVDTARLLRLRNAEPVAQRPQALADLCRRLLAEAFGPAAVLINRRHECLYFLGNTDQFLKVAPGQPAQDLLAMARDDVRVKLRAAIQQCGQSNARADVGGGRMRRDGEIYQFTVSVIPVPQDGDELMLVCFIDQPVVAPVVAATQSSDPAPRVEEIEQELVATRAELRDAVRSLEMSAEEQKAINEEALSVSEEYQATNEELLASKEELQSLNEELTALNGQLQETLERQRTTADDLQNVLYSTDVATLFLDTGLRIRFFTPATRKLFNVIPGDIGRPLADLSALTVDIALLDDAREVIRSLVPIEREVAGAEGRWYLRRILPYRSEAKRIDGVVITFTDITDRRHVADALEAAKSQAQLANAAKSRFLAAASHDLRQPLQTMALLQGLLAAGTTAGQPRQLLDRLKMTLDAMSGMLDVLLDINQIDAGLTKVHVVDFRIDTLLDRLYQQFALHAKNQGLKLRLVDCGLSVQSDPALLEQMLRNLLSNALKYTQTGRVLLGCRRHGDTLSVEVWDTGVGIPDDELQSVFEEYHQVDNAARERSRGLGLGLSIVHRLGMLLGHRVQVRSKLGRGSMFSIEVPCVDAGGGVARTGALLGQKPFSPMMPAQAPGSWRLAAAHAAAVSGGTILVVDDDPQLCELLGMLLMNAGFRVMSAADGPSALGLFTPTIPPPSLMLVDFNLPRGMTGLQLAEALRVRFHLEIPTIVLTADTALVTLRHIADARCTHLTKPVTVAPLLEAVQQLLQAAPVGTPARVPAAAEGAIYVVDDDAELRQALGETLREAGHSVETRSSSEAFLDSYRPGSAALVLIDAYLPGMSGMALLHNVRQSGDHVPVIMITGRSDVAMAVEAMKAGALDFIEKPFEAGFLLASVERVLAQSGDASVLLKARSDAASHLARLTRRQLEIMHRVLAGEPSKNIAADLGISRRTVETHRAAIMKKTGAKSIPALARLALSGAASDAPGVGSA